MALHNHTKIDMSSSSLATLLSRASPSPSPLLATTRSDIVAILQQEQDHAVSLLSMSPLLSSLFISYAARAAVIGSCTTSPPPESGEWKSLQDTIAALQEENEKLKSEIHHMAGKLETAETSREVFHSQISSLKEVNATQEEDIRSLRAQVSEAKHNYDRLVEDSNAEKAALRVQISDLETQRGQLRDTAVKQQIRISRLERPMGDDAIRGPLSPLRTGGPSLPLPDSPISPFQSSLSSISSPYGNIADSPPSRSPVGNFRPHPMSRGLIGTRLQPRAGDLRSEGTLSGWFGDDHDN